MERLTKFWYRLVALPLVNRVADLEDHYETILTAYRNAIKELNETKLEVLTISQELRDWKERASTANNDGAIAMQVIRERLRAGEMGSVLGARDHASRMRINELEVENYNLRKKLWGK